MTQRDLWWRAAGAVFVGMGYGLTRAATGAGGAGEIVGIVGLLAAAAGLLLILAGKKAVLALRVEHHAQPLQHHHRRAGGGVEQGIAGHAAIHHALLRTGGEDGAKAVAEKLFGHHGLRGHGAVGLNPKSGDEVGCGRGMSKAFFDLGEDGFEGF